MKAKNVCDLPLADDVKDSDGILITQDGKARRMTMDQLKSYGAVNAGIKVDDTLTHSGMAADAAAAGNAIAAERARINELVAMRGDSNNAVYEFENVDGIITTIESNGSNAKVTVRFPDMPFITNTTYQLATIPDGLQPLGDFSYESGSNLYILSGTTLSLHYTGPSVVVSQHDAEFFYSLQCLFISELADLRVGYNGTVYASAGDAVRGQIGNIENALDSIIAVQEELIGGDGA